MAADSPWPLRFDLMCANALVWVVTVGREADLTREAHLFFFDRYHRLARFHKRRGHQAAYTRLQAKAEAHYRASGGSEPPYAAMAMPRPRRLMVSDAIAGRNPHDPDDVA